MLFWPQKTSFSEIIINSIWSLIAWIIWSITILIITFILWDYLNITWTFQLAQAWLKTTSMFPLVLSLITLVWTSITMYLTYKLLIITSENRYKKNIIISAQIAFFSILTYLFITPLYIYLWIIKYEYIMYIFLAHTLIVTFWTNIIIELLNNYRYILIWLYWSFVWLFISIIITILIFTSFNSWNAKLILLIILLPIINFCTTLFKQLFEYLYYIYFKYSNLDQLWDIFYQIEIEEREILREEEEKNTI